MLRVQSVATPTLDLLRRLQARPAFASLRLVGGTALALQIGHRKSDDLDLFGELEADHIAINTNVNAAGQATLLARSQNIHAFNIAGIKVDFVNYPYPWLAPPLREDGLTLAAMPDIAAMKLAAITNRGSKKDFIDIFFLLREFTLGQLLDFYSRKFNDGSAFLVLKSLAYFDDAEKDPSPVMLAKAAWPKVKQRIAEAIENHLGQPPSDGRDH